MIADSIQEAIARARPMLAPFPYWQDVIHLFRGGSDLHGTRAGQGDLDLFGVYIEPPEMALGIDKFEHFVSSTSGQEERNGPDDVDVCLYSLRRWAFLAAKGNPSALEFLAATNSADSHLRGGEKYRFNLDQWYWDRVVVQAGRFYAKSAAKQFLGYANGQLQRMLGQRGQGKHGQRPELEAAHGYDVKAASQVFRLLAECREMLEHCRITMPRPEAERQKLLSIRRGEWRLEKVLRESQLEFKLCEEAVGKSSLPSQVDRQAISALVAKVCLEYWTNHHKEES